MSFDSEYLELRKKRKKQEETGTQKVVSRKPLNDELMDIAPVRFQSTLNAVTQQKKPRQKANEPKLDFFKTPDAFKDGYNIGDVTKTILGTAGDIAVGAARGFAHTVEGAGDLISYGIAGASDLFGNYDFADSLRAEAKKDLTEKLLGKQSEIVSKNSVLGRTSQGVSEMIGQLATMGATGGASELAGLGKVGSTILTTGVLGTSATGSGMSEAYQGGATDEEALTYGLISGAAETITEMFFGGLGKGINAVGFSKGLLSADDMLAKKVAGLFESQIAKNLAEYGIKAGAEGVEEILAGTVQAIGKHRTYMSDKELADILANENLLEQFVVGAIGSGFAQSVDLYNANKSGTDFITGLTQNEQAVVDKEVKNRVAEKEADGKKLTNREKNKIYDAVIKDLDKGYISTDTIEEALGGETYKSYKDTIDNETALQNEFNTLNKMKQSEMTGEQTDRRAELKQKLEELKNNSNKTQLKEQLSNDVFNLVKGSRLVESYSETARRGQTFEADLSKYDAKQQEVVKKAVESGILNNTNRTHEFVDMVAKISADKGVIFDFSNNEKIKESGFAVDGKTVNGYVDGNGNISLNIDSSKALNSVVGHEITHILEGTELHDALKDVVKQYATTKGEYDTRLQTLSKLYEGVDGANIENELTADLIGDYLFTDSDFINKLSTESRNVFKKIYDEIKYLCKIATSGSKEARELERVKRAFEKAYKESANTKAKSDTKYSLSDSEGRNLTKEQAEYFKDSKVRDAEGNLIPVYHGTFEDFTVFDINKTANANIFGKGHYFTSDIADAEYNYASEDGSDVRTKIEDLATYYFEEMGYSLEDQYDNDNFDDWNKAYDKALEEFGEGKILTSYLNITNPLYVNEDGSYYDSQGKNVETITDEYDGIIDQYVSKRFDMKNISDSTVHYVVFNSNQIKNIDNQNPTKDADIRYSLSEDSKDRVFYTPFGVEVVQNPTNAEYRQMREDIYNAYPHLRGTGEGILRHTYDEEGNVYYWNAYDGMHSSVEPYINKHYNTRTSQHWEWWKRDDKDDYPTDYSHIRYSLSKDSEGRELTKEQQNYFKNAKTVDENGRLKPFYHGTGRADRVGNVFDPARATSGPMAYFTDSKEIADNYARDKKDTSIAYDSDYDSYETQFRVTRNGKDMSVIDLWNTLSMSERNAITEKAKHITMDDDWENVVYSEDADYGLGNFDKYELNRHRGNALHTLVDSWLTDGNIFGEEHKFLDVLKLVGIEDARYMNPEFRDEKTYQVYLNITNPFDTSNISNEMLEALRVASENAEYVEGNMADLWDKRNIEPTRWFEGLKDDIENGTSYTWTRIPDFVTDTLKAHGYDGIFDKGGKNGGAGHTVAIPFYSEQVKNVDNLNPTTSNDIRYSLLDTDNLPKLKGSHLTYGEDIKLRTNEDIAPVVENAPVETAEQVAPTQNVTTDDVLPDGFALISEEEANAIREEGFNALNDIDAPLETSTEPYSIADTTRLDDKTLNNISSILKDVLSLNKAETKAIQDIVQNYSTSETQNTDDLFNEIKDRFGEKTWTERNEEIAEVKQTLRNYKLRVSPTIKGDIADYSDFMRRNFGKLVISKNGMPVDTAYMELSATYPEFFPPDVTNATDQLLKMSEVANMDINESLTAVLDDETIQEATDIISDIVNTYKENAIRQGVEADNQSYLTQLDRYFELLGEGKSEAIKPRPEKLVGEEEQWTKNKMARADKVKGNAEQTAKIITDEPKVEKKKNRAWSKFVSNFVDKASPFETLALKTGNREVDAKFNTIRYAEGKAQNLIGKGAEGVKALNDIIAEVKADGLTDSLYEYLYHKHNVDRMTLEDRYKDVPNKAVFGDSVTAKVSQDIVDQYEFAEPKLVEYANEIYNYNRHLRKMLVDGGVISQETADLWEEMYPHYVPIRRQGDDGLNINVPLDTGRTGVNAPIKRATGGSRDILPLFDTMAQRTIQTYKAIAKNRFGVELKNTLGTTVENAETNLDEVIDSIDTQESLLQEGKNGRNPTFTVFENGEKITFEITEEMYDALKPTSEGLAYTNKALNTINNVRRGLLTEYNPTFMFTNAVKDAQDVLINSQHPARTYKNFPKAIKELATKGGKWYSEYMENGGEQNTYFEKDTNTFKEEKTGIAKLIGMPLDKIGDANNFIERIPRLAEYIASREMGRSIDVAMLDSARVTTNFSAGGDVTKFLNRNGATFLNASIQGAVQQVRNVREAKYNGLKGWVQLGAKTMLAGLPALLLNGLLWDDDEEYEELSDYVKENYYIVAKFGDGKFVRIPKGRAVAVIQNAFEQTWNALTGDDEVDLNRFLELAISNLAPNNPLDNNVIAPVMQVANNETWYGEDLVPTRLQDLPNAEQYDESTDAISKWLGEKLNYSPYKINYLLDQYSGGIGDMILPMLTPEAESGNNSFSGNLLAPIKDKFTTDSVMNNQVVSDFYKTSDELTTNAKSSKATDEDILKYKYINSVQTEMGELYAEKREIQNSNLSDEIKYKKVREIQEEINALSENALNTYGTVNIDGNYANVGDRHYRLNDENEWQKINDKQLEKQEEVTSGLGITPAEYWNNKAEYDYAYDSPEKYAVAKAVGGYSAYKTYSSELYDIHADKDSNGKSISGSRKEKVLDYINNLDIDYYEKLILFKSEYNADDTYNYEIIDYLNNRDDISYEEEVIILKELGFNVDSNGNISW